MRHVALLTLMLVSGCGSTLPAQQNDVGSDASLDADATFEVDASLDADATACATPVIPSAPSASLPCVSPRQCEDAGVCCVETYGLTVDASCPADIRAVGSPYCGGDCESNSVHGITFERYLACQSNADCPSGKTCSAVTLTHSSPQGQLLSTNIVGVCL